MSETDQRKKKQRLWPVAPRPKGNGRDTRNAPFSMPQLAQWQVQDGRSQQLIQIETSVLHPQLNYKTVLVNQQATVHQVVGMMVERHAIRPTDQDPDNFLLTECVESSRGSYTRVLDDDDLVLDIQDRWKDNEGYFKLSRKPSKLEEDEKKNGTLLEEDSELSATVLPPSESLENLQFSPARPWTKDKKRRMSLPSSSTTRESAGLQHMFHDAIGEGMSGIMSRVVIEGEQLRERKGTWSTGSTNNNSPQHDKLRGRDRHECSPKPDMPSVYSFVSASHHRSPLLSSRQKKEVIRIEPLFYSPSVSARREFPQFVFSPSKNVDERKDETIRAESPTSHDFMVVDSTMVEKSHLPAFSSSSPAAPIDPASMLKSEDCFTVPTEVGQSTFHSDMNLLDSLSTILEAKISTLGGKKLVESPVEQAPPSEQDMQCAMKPSSTTERLELISPSRRNRLVAEVCNKIRGRRSQSCPLLARNTHRHGEGSAMNQRCVSSSPLVSPARKKKLIEKASELARKQESERLVLATKSSSLITHRLLYTSPQVSPTLNGPNEKDSCESFIRSVDTSHRAPQLENSEEQLARSVQTKRADSPPSAKIPGKIRSVSKLFSFSRHGSRGRERQRTSTEGKQFLSHSQNLARHKMTRSVSENLIQVTTNGQIDATTD